VVDNEGPPSNDENCRVCVEKGSSFRNQRDTGYCNVDAETMRQIIKSDFVISD
jgi:hypothetical protein